MPTLQPESPLSSLQRRALAQAIDHTKLTFLPEEVEAVAIATLCQQAKDLALAAVCVRPQHVAQAKAALVDSGVKVATVIGFPADKVSLVAEKAQPTVGGFSWEEKRREAQQALAAGADEFDLVMNVAVFKADVRQQTRVARDEWLALRALVGERPIKLIIETDLLTPSELTQAVQWCAETGMDMVKTSTGMVVGGQGGTVEIIQQIMQVIQAIQPLAQLHVKASGGIKTREQALALLALGVARIGTSSALAILEDSSAGATGHESALVY